jgi:hypothetical protein
MAHEDLTRGEQVSASSDRSFGFVFAGVFAIVAAWPLIHAQPVRWWAAGLAALLAAVAVWAPRLLALPNKAWSKLGVVLGNVVSPIALAVLFYGVITPIGALMRMTGKDPLRLKSDPAQSSYWIQRDPPGPRPDSLNHPF